jgi:methionyl-tRNA formyltransferase
MRLAYFGTPNVAVPPLRALVEAGHDVVHVVSRADKKRGRGGAVSPSPVKSAAAELALSVSDEPDDVVGLGAELGVVVAYGRIIKPPLLREMPMVNLHFSLLPRWRGAAPVERAILAGDAETGVALMRLEEGLDTGGIYAEQRVLIDSEITAEALRAELVAVGSALLVQTLSRPLDEWIESAAPQVGEAVYASKLTRDEFELDWSNPAVDTHRRIRVGGAWTMFRDKRLRILAADLIDGRIVPTMVQPEGKGAMTFDAWRNGARPSSGELFGAV